MKNIKIISLFFLIMLLCFTLIRAAQADGSGIDFIPVKHASFIIRSASAVIYVDPVGDVKLYSGLPAPDLILITHSHQDHLDAELINKLKRKDSLVVGPKDVIKALGFGTLMKNNDHRQWKDVFIQALPMYNTTKDRLKFHPKGQGNGYVLSLEGKKIYISGDTEDIKEMRQLKDIDYAFVCMNLPYTMTVEQAASAVLEFKPKVVFPYHYKGTEGYSDLDKFRSLVNGDKNIEVRILYWYAE